MYKISYIERFKKGFNKHSNNELALFQNMIRLFIEDVLQSSLRTKKIKCQEELYKSSKINILHNLLICKKIRNSV